jgi:Spy/CpxP family protein refolding chaperone
MKRSMIVLGALMISSVIFAQTKDKHRHGGEAGLEKFKKELSLNDVQYASIKGINKKYAGQFSLLRKDSVTSKTERHTAIKNLRVEKQKEITAVLTADQKMKYEKLKKERSEKRKAQIKTRDEERHAKLAKDLSLTVDQAVKVSDANKAFIEKAKALRQNSSGDKASNKEALKKLRKEHDATMQSVLTPDQFTKWKEMRKSKHGKGKR